MCGRHVYEDATSVSTSASTKLSTSRCLDHHWRKNAARIAAAMPMASATIRLLLSTLAGALAHTRTLGVVQLTADERRTIDTVVEPAKHALDRRAVIATVPSPSDAPVFLEPLTEREQEVLDLMQTHMSYPEITDTLFVSINTVRSHTKAGRRSDENHAVDVIRHRSPAGRVLVHVRRPDASEVPARLREPSQQRQCPHLGTGRAVRIDARRRCWRPSRAAWADPPGRESRTRVGIDRPGVGPCWTMTSAMSPAPWRPCRDSTRVLWAVPRWTGVRLERSYCSVTSIWAAGTNPVVKSGPVVQLIAQVPVVVGMRMVANRSPAVTMRTNAGSFPLGDA